MWRLRSLLPFRTTAEFLTKDVGIRMLHSRGSVPLTFFQCSGCVHKSSNFHCEAGFGSIRADLPRFATTSSFMAWQGKVETDQVVSPAATSAHSQEGLAVSNFSAVLQYWFKDYDPADGKFPNEFWFAGGPAVDSEIKEKFEPTLKLAAKGDLDHWATTPQGTLALVIVLDQFSRNIFRDTPHAFAQDQSALKLVLEAIKKGWDRELGPMERTFLYMPLTHAEDLQVHEDAERAFGGLCEKYKGDELVHKALLGFLDFERKHAEVLSKYGRYPSRNAALGRKDTPEEADYNASGKPWG